MKKTILIALPIMLICSCNTQKIDRSEAIREVMNAETEFMQMVQEKGIAEGFAWFADDSAVILRGRDSLIKGKDAIRHYYSNPAYTNAKVTWKPDFVEVSECGTLAYTYGKFVWRAPKENVDTLTLKGIFHTVWKRQADGKWKYVWD